MESSLSSPALDEVFKLPLLGPGRFAWQRKSQADQPNHNRYRWAGRFFRIRRLGLWSVG